MFDERSFYNQCIYNIGVLRTLHINGPNWLDNDLQNTTHKTEVSERFTKKFEDTKKAIKTHKSKDRQHNDKTKEKGQKDKKTIFLNTTQKTEDSKIFQEKFEDIEERQTTQWPKEKKMKRQTNNIDQHEPYHAKTIIILKTHHHTMQ